MYGFSRFFTPPRARREEPPGKYQAGYLWGKGRQVDVVGDENGWHWRASAGKALAYWSLWYGDREVGFNSYPTNEARDWPDMLFQMVLGLKGIAECPIDDDELDEIRHNATVAAESMKGFPGSRESKQWQPKCPYPKGSVEADIWEYTFRSVYAALHRCEFLGR